MAFNRKRGEPSDLFAGLKGKGIEAVLDVPVAVMVPMVAMLWADQEKQEAETELIHAICRFSPIFLKPSARQIDDWISAAEALVNDKQIGHEAACRRAKDALTIPLRQTAYAFAMQVLFADEMVVVEERKEAAEMAEWLGVERALAGEIIKVVSIQRHSRDAR
jgi:hypothetical protein